MISRLANKPIAIPKGVKFSQSNNQLKIEGNKTILLTITTGLRVVESDNTLKIDVVEKDGRRKPKVVKKLKSLSGTLYALLRNNLEGANEGFKKKLILVGVGYRAQAQGNIVNLTLGFSHPVAYSVPNGVKIETPTQTEVVLSSFNRQLLGQAAAEICAFRPIEVYKGKGIRPEGFKVVLKETKKK